MPENNSEQSDSLPAYRKAMLQTVAYKHIRDAVSAVLKSHGLNLTQWMVLGILYEQPNGQKTSAIAHMLQVEVPLITTLSQQLLRHGYVEQTQDSHDKRSKPLQLTDAGRTMMTELERTINGNIERLETGLSPDQLVAYFQALQTFITNGEQLAS